MSYPYAPGASTEHSEVYVFPTDNGLFYIVEFYNALNHFEKSDEILLNSRLIFEIGIKRKYLEGPPPRNKRHDPEIFPTISDILDKHIESHGALPIYFFICDDSDGKEAARFKLFCSEWYSKSQLDNWVMFSYEIEGVKDEFQQYYIGLLIHINHPNFEIYPDLFEKFITGQVAQGKILNGGRV